MYKYILASGSPRRKELLAEKGLKFTIMKTDTEEAVDPSLLPKEVVVRLADEKLDAAIKKLEETSITEPTFVICADTLVALGNEIFGKPVSRENAIDILWSLSGSAHQVYTGVAIGLLTPQDDKVSIKRISDFGVTSINFKELTQEEIEAYVDSGESYDKAGGYAIQETGDAFVTSIDGPYDNVVGLPVDLVFEMLDKLKG